MQETAVNEPQPDVEQTARFILDDIAAKGYRNNKAFFYGGEPLLRRQWIRRFIELTRGELEHVAQTNGVLLSALGDDLIREFRYLEISVDGVREIHDAHRGAGTFDRVVENLRAIEGVFTGERVARMTYTPENPLARSVKLILEDLGFAETYWMHEDSTIPVEQWNDNLPAYDRDLDELLDYWMEGIRRGEVRGIIPFKSMVHSMLIPPVHSCVRCGVGHYLMVIDTDGTVYPCDLMITPDKRYAIGHITTGVGEITLPPNRLRDQTCRPCEYFGACGGRCYQLGLKNDTRFPVFCERTKLLARKLEAVLPEIEALIETGVLTADDIEIKTTMTEQIP